MLSSSFERHRFSRQASKNEQAECKVKACFQTLLKRSRFSRRSLKERTLRQGTILLPILRFSSLLHHQTARYLIASFVSCYNFKLRFVIESCNSATKVAKNPVPSKCFEKNFEGSKNKFF